MLPIKPNWVDDPYWEQPLAAVDRVTAHGVLLARGALREVFPQSLTHELVASAHPVVAEQFTYVGRLRLLELGLAIALAGAEDAEVDRLRKAAEFDGVAAELRASLMLVRAGARLERPIGAPGRMLCERLATFPGGERLSLEAKLPDESERDLHLVRVESTLIGELMQRFEWLQTHVSAARATFHFAPEISELLGSEGATDRRNAAIEQAVERVRAAVSEGSPFTTIELGVLGTLAIRPEAALQNLQFDAFGPPMDARRTKRRLTRNLLSKAANQVSETGLPGVIILDLRRDYAAINAVGLLDRWAMQRPSLAAILVVDSTVMATDGRMYGNVDVVPGPRFSEVSTVLAGAFDSCSSGHVHYNPLCTPSSPCPLAWLARVA
jgi:hypothetical protein